MNRRRGQIRSNFDNLPPREQSYRNARNANYESMRFDGPNAKTYMSEEKAVTPSKSQMGRDKFRARMARNIEGKEMNKKFNDDILNRFAQPEDVDPLYTVEFQHDTVSYESGIALAAPYILRTSGSANLEFQNYAKLMDMVLIGQIDEDVTDDDGEVTQLTNDSNTFYRDLKYITPCAAQFLSSTRRLMNNRSSINQVGRRRTQAEIRQAVITNAHRYRLGHYLALVPDVKLWIYLVRYRNRYDQQAVMNAILARIRLITGQQQHEDDALDFNDIPNVIGLLENSRKESSLIINFSNLCGISQEAQPPGLLDNDLVVPRHVLLNEMVGSQKYLRGVETNLLKYWMEPKEYSSISVPVASRNTNQYIAATPLIDYRNWLNTLRHDYIIGSYDGYDTAGSLFSTLFAIHCTIGDNTRLRLTNTGDGRKFTTKVNGATLIQRTVGYMNKFF